MRRLEGKVALITGTARGQGRAAAVRFAEEGATVVGCDRNADDQAETVRLVEAAGGRMVARAVDLSQEDEVRSWIDFAVSEVGDFDILYNNASDCRFALIEDMTREDWDYSLANELTIVFLAVKHAVPVFTRRGGGCILNIASTQGMGGGMPSGFTHAATKAGVIAMTFSLAVELAPLGVRVNAIAPGLIDTPGLKAVVEGPVGAAIKQASLVRRIGVAEDIAAAAAYLCSDEASYVTGTTLAIDGGGLAGTMPSVRTALSV
jgi:NAD(P)-dependent dehydrogenase (short-subunit alcohol dehydrogenase family)